jgi:hypothetical protein
MEDIKVPEELHLEGEEGFAFPTAGGMVRLSVTQDTLTPYGGLVPWAAYTRHLGIIERLAEDCPVKRSSPNASPVYDILQSHVLTALTDGRRFSHIERLREDPTIPELFGMESVVSSDTVRRFMRTIDPVTGAEWIGRHAQPLWRALPDPMIADWDSTVQPKYGHQEGAEVGYNPGKPGRRSLHPLLAVIAGTRLCPAYRFRSGDTVTATQWQEAMEDAERWLGDRKIWLNRGDLGLGHEAVMAWHEQRSARPHYLFKLKLTPGVRQALHQVPEEKWQGLPTESGWPRYLRSQAAGLCRLGPEPDLLGGAQARVRCVRDEPAGALQCLANPSVISGPGQCGKRLRRAEEPVGLQRLLLEVAGRNGTGRPPAALGLQPVGAVRSLY